MASAPWFLLLIQSVVVLVSADNCSYDVFAFTSNVDDNPDYYKSFPWDKITTIGVFGDFTNQDKANLRDYTHDQGKKIVVATSTSHIDDIYNQTQVSEWIQAQIDQAIEQNYDGVNIDYEGHAVSQTEGYNNAVIQLCNAFHEQLPGSEVSIDAPFYPEYEGRNYDYKSIAEACDYLFVMAYDGEFWDNIQCAVTTPNCSMATASFELCEFGVQKYIEAGVAPNKLYLGLPWYGIMYEYIAGIPFYTGQMKYSDIQTLINDQTARGEPGNLTYVNVTGAEVMRYQCNGYCNKEDLKDRTTEIWFDDPNTLTPKYNLATTYGLKGVGMWEASHVDYTTSDVEAMWAPIC
jgi:spore germination protein YaaH